MGAVRLSWLGTPQGIQGKTVLRFPTRKVLALLVYLTVEGGLHSREKLAALFWPESPHEQARATLRYTLASLRNVLDEAGAAPALIARRDVIGIAPTADLDLDLREVDAAYSLVTGSPARGRQNGDGEALITLLERAIAAWHGDFLDGFLLRDAPEFDDWVGFQREAWHRRIELITARLCQLQADRGDTRDAIETAARWLSLSPLDERAHRRLIQLYLTTGDRHAALRAYDACRDVLSRELDAEPAPETQALLERIRQHAPGAPAVPPAGRQPAHDHLAPGNPLIGRATEFLRLVTSYHATRLSDPEIVVLRGEAGIGKTRLASEFCAWAAAQGADVVRGRAFETSGRLPYQPIVDALRPRLAQEHAPDDLLSDIWLAELSRILPELRDRYPDLALPTGDEVSARTRLFEAVARLGQALAETAAAGALVVFVDDVQWADVASLDVLHYSARRWLESHAHVLLLLCQRAEVEAESSPFNEWQIGLARDASVTQLSLGPLDYEETLQLLQSVLPATSLPVRYPETIVPASQNTSAAGSDRELHAFAQWLFQETGGQPFFITETLRALRDRGAFAAARPGSAAGALRLTRSDTNQLELEGFLAPRVRELISTRIARLSPAARTLLTAAAVLGQRFSFRELCQVGGIDEDAALPALDDLQQAHLIRELSTPESQPSLARYGFSHDRIRDVATAEAGGARRQVFHGRALQALAGGPAAELARHAIAAGLDEAAIRHSLTAGDDAMRLLAARDAIGHYTRAIDLAERHGWDERATAIRARRAKAFASVSLWADAKRDLEDTIGRLVPGQRERRAELLVDLAEVCWWLLDLAPMRRHASDAVELAREAGRADLETAALGWLAGAAGADGDLAACIDQYQRGVERARASATSLPAHVLTLHALALYWTGRLDEAIERSRAGVEAARRANDASVMMYSLPHLALALAGQGQYDEALAVFAEARRFGREYAIDALLARSIAMSAGLHLDLFAFDHAAAIAEEARELALSASFPPTAASASIDLLFSYVRQGDIGRAEPLVAAVAAQVEQAAGFHGWLWRLRLLQARAEIALARRRWEEAIRLAGGAVDQSRARGRPKYTAAGLLTRAAARARFGHREGALPDLEAAIRIARSLGDPALVLRVATVALQVRPDDTLAAEASRTAERICKTIGDDRLRQSFKEAESVRALLTQRRPA